MAKLFFFFIDGIGLGEDSEEINPMRDFLSPFLGSAPFTMGSVPRREKDYLLLPIDAAMGIDGRPQSATGQTTIVTGVNAAEHLGYHMRAFPNEKLIDLIQRKNLFIELTENGVSATCANLYSHEFLEERRKRHKNMLPVSTLSMEAAGIPLRFIDEYRGGRALFADITNRFLRNRGYDIPLITPTEGADRIRKLFSEHQFVFFEYFLTDSYGHSRNYGKIKEEVKILNEFISALWRQNAGGDALDILITSDHGNAEDNRIGDHTLNPVPFFLASRNRKLLQRYGEEIHDLSDVKGAILDYFDIGGKRGS